MFTHEMNKSRKLLLKTEKNRTVQFDKLDGPVSLAPAAVKGTIGSGEGVLLTAKWRLTKGRDKIHNNSRSCGGGGE
jgi:hypothetical protein